MKQKALFIFRQDLRIFDNTGFIHALSSEHDIIPLFIFDTTVLSKFPQDDQRIGFLIEHVDALQKMIQEKGGDLHITYGDGLDEAKKIADTYKVDSIHWNRSYGENSKHRDEALRKRAEEKEITCIAHNDYLLVEPGSVDQRKVFTPFYKLRMEVPKKFECLNSPEKIKTPLLQDSKTIDEIKALLPYAPHPSWPVNNREKRIDSMQRNHYDDQRNIPGIDGTSKLSPYLRFGAISPRQIFREAIRSLNPQRKENEEYIIDETLGILIRKSDKTITMQRKIFKNSFVSELAWREFWQHIEHYFEWTTHTEFQEKRRAIDWKGKKERFTYWKNGETGYPIVDAAMRQLQAENWMHGRCRMVVASFLTKDLLIDRRLGERHFENYLIDYDRNINIGNWQRSASVGADPKPLRIFNPILQSQRFDPNCDYILKRIPELKGQDIKAIHDPIKYDLDYFEPIVDHYVTSKIAKKLYKKETLNEEELSVFE